MQVRPETPLSSSRSSNPTIAEKKGETRHKLKSIGMEILRATSLDAETAEKVSDLEMQCKTHNISVRDILGIPKDSDIGVVAYLEQHFRLKSSSVVDSRKAMAGRFAARISARLPVSATNALRVEKVEAWIAFLQANTMGPVLAPYPDKKTEIDAWLATRSYDSDVRPAFLWLRLLSDLLITHAELKWTYDTEGIELPRPILEALVRAAYTALHKKSGKGRTNEQEQKTLIAVYPILPRLKDPTVWVDPGIVSNLMKSFR